MAPSDAQKRLALSIIDYLQKSLKDGSLSADDAENVEVASSCIADAFKIDPSDKTAMANALGSQSLLNIYSVYDKMNKSAASTSSLDSASGKSTTPQAKSATDTSTSSTGSAAVNPEAEKLKSAGNTAMQQKDYKTAIAKYTEAISYSPTNPIFLSNRAAAYSASGDHVSAAADAEIAVAADPKYTKAWSRLGLAKFAMGDARGSAEAYQKGIEYEGSGGSEAMKKGLETAKKEVTRMEEAESQLPDDEVDDAATTGRGTAAGSGLPDLASLAGMFGGGGGGGGGGDGGGMPDLAGMMNNPMFAGMARNLMQNPEAMSGLLNNPRIQQMMQGMQGEGRGGGAGGMPDMSQLQGLMSDPNIANLAQQFMGGGAGRGAGRGA